MRTALIALCLLAPVGLAADRPDPPTITVGVPGKPGKPTEVQGQPGRAVRLEAAAAGSVEWYTLEDADLIPAADGKTATFVAAKPGRYLVLCVTAKGDHPSPPAAVVITVGTPEPEPGPQPRPVDPLVKRFRDAMLADAGTEAQKKNWLADLVELYRQAVAFAAEPSVVSAADLAAKVIAAGKAILPAAACKGVRTEIAAMLSEAFPEDVALTDASRKQAAELFARISLALVEAAK